MSRHIDADALEERIMNSPLFPNFGEDGLFIRDFIIDLIKESPTVSVTHIKNDGHITINIRGNKHD